MRYIYIYKLINFRLILNFRVLVSMLCMCNLIVYFMKILFYTKLCNNINIFLINTNINWFLFLIMNFVRNYFIKKHTMIMGVFWYIFVFLFCKTVSRTNLKTDFKNKTINKTCLTIIFIFSLHTIIVCRR